MSERSHEEWKALAAKNGFTTFAGINGFMDGFAAGEKEAEKTSRSKIQDRDEIIIHLKAKNEGHLAVIKMLQKDQAGLVQQDFECRKLIAEKQNTIDEQKKYVAETNDRILSATAMIEKMKIALRRMGENEMRILKAIGGFFFGIILGVIGAFVCIIMAPYVIAKGCYEDNVCPWDLVL